MAEEMKAEATVSELEQKLRQEYEEKFEIWKAKDLASLAEAQEGKIQEEVARLFENWQKEQKPPSLEDIKKMLEQEYVEIEIQIPVRAKDGTRSKRTFVIRELPQAIERTFYRQFKERLKDQGPQLNAFAQRNMDQPFEKQISAFLDAFDSGFDILADAVVLCLNPFGDEEEITNEWVARNIASNRQYSIVMAQVEVNRLRDFFSRLFQSGQKVGTMMTPLNFQQLQRLAR